MPRFLTKRENTKRMEINGNVHKTHTRHYPVISRFLTQVYSCQEQNKQKATDPTQ
jgi:hypothetical protein